MGGMTAAARPHIEALVSGDGRIMIGAIKSARNAAVWPMMVEIPLPCCAVKKAESVALSLVCLDAAIAATEATGERVDDLNQLGAKWT